MLEDFSKDLFLGKVIKRGEHFGDLLAFGFTLVLQNASQQKWPKTVILSIL